jgi:hypothetical protein
MEDRYYDVVFEYIDGSKDEIKLRDDHYDDLIAHIKEKGFVGCFEDEEAGYYYNLALVKCIY